MTNIRKCNILKTSQCFSFCSHQDYFINSKQAVIQQKFQYLYLATIMVTQLTTNSYFYCYFVIVILLFLINLPLTLAFLLLFVDILLVSSNPITPQMPENNIDHRHISYVNDKVITKREAPYIEDAMKANEYIEPNVEAMADPYDQYAFKEEDDDYDDENDDEESDDSGESGNDYDDSESGAESGESGESDDSDEKDLQASKRDLISERTVSPKAKKCCVIQ